MSGRDLLVVIAVLVVFGYLGLLSVFPQQFTRLAELTRWPMSQDPAGDRARVSRLLLAVLLLIAFYIAVCVWS